MTLVPIPENQLKSNTWYYGIRCTCRRLHAVCEDLFEGKTDETHINGPGALKVACQCGEVIPATRLSKFKTP